MKTHVGLAQQQQQQEQQQQQQRHQHQQQKLAATKSFQVKHLSSKPTHTHSMYKNNNFSVLDMKFIP